MKIHLKLSLLLIAFLIFLILIASDYEVPDTTITSGQDLIQIKQSQATEKMDIFGWIEDHQVLIAFLGVILLAIAGIIGAAISGLFVLKAKNKELKAKDKELKVKLAQAEKDKQTAIQQAAAKALAESKARLKAAQEFEVEEKEKILETEEDRYLEFVITKNEKLPFQGFETAVKTPILLWDVYVPLRANVMVSGMRDMGLGERGEFPERRDLSIEEAVQLEI